MRVHERLGKLNLVEFFINLQFDKFEKIIKEKNFDILKFL